MLNSKGFDEWAAGYDASVRHSHDAGEYPFAGYDAVLSLIEARVNSRPGADVLDLGFGTGMLTARLYAAGHPVAGVDFSQNMLDAARTKMPCAELYLYDFTRGLPPAPEGRTFDFIISTYAFHHVPDAGKPAFLLELSRRLSPGGECLIGDVAFETQARIMPWRRCLPVLCPACAFPSRGFPTARGCFPSGGTTLRSLFDAKNSQASNELHCKPIKRGRSPAGKSRRAPAFLSQLQESSARRAYFLPP